MRTLAALMRRHSVVSYFCLAYALSWAVWIPMALAGMRAYQGSAWPSHIPGLLGPMLAAFVMSALLAGGAGVADLLRRMFRWRVPIRWYLVALSPLAFFVLASIAMSLTGQGWPDLGQLGTFASLPVVAVPVMWVLLLVTAYAEETGWRGFAVPEMLKKRSFLTTAVVIGLLWALWHVPSMFVIENYRQMGLAIIPIFTLGIVAGSILLTWLYRASGGSVFIVALWHATYNLVAGTAVAHGLVAAIVSTGVMAWAVLIVIVEIRSWLRDRRAKAGLTPAAG
jgi:membrane protease YdiL (CAAX protease family)